MKGIVIHCSDSVFGSATKIRDWHVNGNGWSDIGYHFVINNGMLEKDVAIEAMDGSIELGRPLGRTGAHAKGYNDYIGICLVGKLTFTSKQMHALVGLLKGLVVKYNIEPENIIGHSEVSSKTCPNFNVRQLVSNIFTEGE